MWKTSDRDRATDRDRDDDRDRDRAVVRDRATDLRDREATDRDRVDRRDRDRLALRDDADDRDGDRRWVELGCRRVSLADRDRDTIDVGKREGWYRAIRLRAEGNDVEIMRIDVVYGNGAPDELDVRRVIRDGRRSEAIDLKGGEKTIDQIQLVYRRLSEERGQTRNSVPTAFWLAKCIPRFQPAGEFAGGPKSATGWAASYKGKY